MCGGAAGVRDGDAEGFRELVEGGVREEVLVVVGVEEAVDEGVEEVVFCCAVGDRLGCVQDGGGDSLVFAVLRALGGVGELEVERGCGCALLDLVWCGDGGAAAVADVDGLRPEVAVIVFEIGEVFVRWDGDDADGFAVDRSCLVGELDGAVGFAVDELLEVGVVGVVGDAGDGAFACLFGDAEEDVRVGGAWGVGEADDVFDDFALLLGCCFCEGVLVSFDVEGVALGFVEELFDALICMRHSWVS